MKLNKKEYLVLAGNDNYWIATDKNLKQARQSAREFKDDNPDEDVYIFQAREVLD